MRVLLDTNVVLDLILEREPFVEDAAALWERHQRSKSKLLKSSKRLSYRKHEPLKRDLATGGVCATSPVAKSLVLLQLALDANYKAARMITRPQS